MGKAARAKAERRAIREATAWRWEPLRPAKVTHPGYSEHEHGVVWMNSTYTVFVRDLGGSVHLSIKRNDRGTAKDWRDFQAIKNQLCGPEWEAVELYPAESRLVDTANQYHLWAYPHPLPVGWFQGRLVTDEPGVGGAVQRPGAGTPAADFSHPAVAALRDKTGAFADAAQVGRVPLTVPDSGP